MRIQGLKFATGLGIGMGVGLAGIAGGATSLLHTLAEFLTGVRRAVCGLDSAEVVRQAVQRWRVPRPEFVLPILQWVGPRLVPDPDAESTLEMEEMI
ncbi:Calmodulin [Lasiodiplodia theobromae]|uniref:Calmodulin n=1 Tax=Lasiodiplodia theobromae TaxID=45133 RepID=UPI0015C3A8A9|nr:Calmodulin [Lasiodiplodia theobromae]KAF4536878.1 Calmodulin [Lasiodiplodia theobromae]